MPQFRHLHATEDLDPELLHSTNARRSSAVLGVSAYADAGHSANIEPVGQGRPTSCPFEDEVA